MNTTLQTDGETQLYNAVKDLSRDDIEQRVQANAAADGMTVTDDHMDVIVTLIEHYKASCQSHDCRAASPHMRFLIDRYEEQGGSKYLYKLFDQVADKTRTGNEVGVLTFIHQLADLPDLTYNEDEGFGTVF